MTADEINELRTHLRDKGHALGDPFMLEAASLIASQQERLKQAEDVIRTFAEYRGSDEYLKSAPDDGICAAASFCAADYRMARTFLAEQTGAG